LCSVIASWRAFRDVCWVGLEADGLVRVKMCWESGRRGYFAYCGSEPILIGFLVVLERLYVWGRNWDWKKRGSVDEVVDVRSSSLCVSGA